MLNPGPDDYLAALTVVQSYLDQPLTLVDATLAVVSSRLEVPVWSYDYHFDVMQTDVWR